MKVEGQGDGLLEGTTDLVSCESGVVLWRTKGRHSCGSNAQAAAAAAGVVEEEEKAAGCVWAHGCDRWVDQATNDQLDTPTPTHPLT